MAVTVRSATIDDLLAILEISNQAIAETTANWDVHPETLEDRRAWFEDRTRNGHPVLVATDGHHRVVGWASYGPFRSRDGYAATVEHSIYITPEAHGRGTGTELMLALIDHARGAGVHAIVGGLDGANEGSLRFHQRLGFTAATPLPAVGRKFGRWLDLVFVTLVLEPASAER